MKYLDKFNENKEGFSNESPSHGDRLPNNDEIMATIKDLFIEVEDMGFRINYMGYGSYGENEVTYRIIITNNAEFTTNEFNHIGDIIKNMDISSKCVILIKELIDRALEIHNNLTFESFVVSNDDGFYSSFDLGR